MAGWDLSVGECNTNEISEDEFWMVMNRFFTSQSKKTTTYKFCLLKCLIDNIFNVEDDLSISYDMIFSRFTEIYWNLIVKYELKQLVPSVRTPQSKIESIMNMFVNVNNIPQFIPFEKLGNDLKTNLSKEIQKAAQRYVVGAFYSDTHGKIFGFSKKSCRIVFNASSFKYLMKHKKAIEKMNYFEWMKFLSKTNMEDSGISIAEKLDFSSKRYNLNQYRNFLLNETKVTKCFYCGNDLTNKNEVDHYIPWSFIKDDKTWNFVISCRMCNNSKSNSLTVKGYLNNIVKRNDDLLNNFGRNEIIKKEFNGYTNDKLFKVYEIAEFSGLISGWKPRQSVIY